MEYEAKLSRFRFKSPKVKSWQFKANNEFVSGSYSNTEIKYTVQVLKAESQNNATVTLELQIGNKGSNDPFYIHAEISSEFSWDEEQSETVNKLLNENAVVLLISYLRPMIAQFTTYAGFAPLNLPYLDVRQKQQ